MPIYVQPVCPAPGYLWTPGYWAWGQDGYYWVPGAWVLPPEVGVVWTPGYWGWGGGAYVWHAGYWGPQVGFYGGINYGYGYPGRGYYGGYWRDGHFFYNREVNRVNVNITNVYVRRVTYRNDSRVSFNGGEGGVRARETVGERQAYQQRRFGPVNRRHEPPARMRSEQRQPQPAGGGWQRFGQQQQTRQFGAAREQAENNGPRDDANWGREQNNAPRPQRANNQRARRRQHAAGNRERGRGNNGGNRRDERRQQRGDRGNGRRNRHRG